jgi:hypothetical protein
MEKFQFLEKNPHRCSTALFLSLFIYHIMSPDPRPAHRSFLSANNIKKKPRRKYNVPCPSHRIAASLILPALLMRKPCELSQFGKKSAKVYHSLYSSTEQLQVAL